MQFRSTEAPGPGSDAVEREIARIRDEYQRRKSAIPADYYSWSRAANQFSHGQLFRSAINALVRHGSFPLAGRRIVDIGCGSGNWLLEFVQWGAEPERLFGVDLDSERIELASKRVPGATLYCTDAQELPLASESTDIVTQFTVFTSILSAEVKKRIASEVIRILKPGGLMLWYDFRCNNPGNPNVRGIRAAELRQLFDGCEISLQSVTLAPPLARKVVPRSWILGLLLESIPFLRTHYLAIIRRPS